MTRIKLDWLEIARKRLELAEYAERRRDVLAAEFSRACAAQALRRAAEVEREGQEE